GFGSVRDAVFGGADRGAAGTKVENAVPDLRRDDLVEVLQPLLRGRDRRTRFGGFGIGAAAVEERPGEVDAKVPRGLPALVARKDLRVRIGKVVSAGKRDGRLVPCPRRPDPFPGAIDPVCERLPFRPLLQSLAYEVVRNCSVFRGFG